MSLLMSFVFTIIFVGLFRTPMKRYPIVFYALAILVAAAGIYFAFLPNTNPPARSLVAVIQKGHVGFALFTIVMFIGVLNKSSAIRHYLTPIRAELSIAASILIIGHMTPYFNNYLSIGAGFFSLKPNVISSLLIAFVLLALLVILTATSFNVIKKRMSVGSWKRIQYLAYPFFILVYFHLLGYLLPSALNGAIKPIISLSVYSIVFVAYIVLRLRREVLDRKIKPESSP